MVMISPRAWMARSVPPRYNAITGNIMRIAFLESLVQTSVRVPNLKLPSVRCTTWHCPDSISTLSLYLLSTPTFIGWAVAISFDSPPPSLSCLSHSSFSQCSLQGCEIVHTWYCCCRIRPNFGLKLSYFFFPLQKETPQLPLSQVDVSPVWWVSLISTIDEKIAVSTREQIQ